MFSAATLFIGTLLYLGINTGKVDALGFLYVNFAKLYSSDFPSGVSLSPYRINQWNSKAETQVVIHNFRATAEDLIVLRNAFLALTDTNVIMVDYSTIASLNYFFAAFLSRGVGFEVSRLLANLVQNNGLDPATVDIIGLELGAQVAGFTGNYFRRFTGQMNGRITGLDPAGFLFQGRGTRQLDATDATFVQVFHTTYGPGNTDNVADADFIFNDPTSAQPGCDADDTLCSQLLSVALLFSNINPPVCPTYVGDVCQEDPLTLVKKVPVLEYPIGKCADPSVQGTFCLECCELPS